MNVIFISPHFPLHFYNFCDRLKRLGVNVLGIGDAPYDSIGKNCQDSLTEYYYVKSLEDYEEVYRAAANVKTARFHLVTDQEGSLSFIRKVGYPVIVKPDNGVGASNTWKLNSDEEFFEFYRTKPDTLFIMEEFIPGHVETFDGITNKDCEILFCTGQVMEQTPMDMLLGSGENVSYTQNVEATDLYDIGSRVVKAFGTRCRFFHFEFFRLDEDKAGLGKKGDVLGLEVNMRAPGGYIPDKMNYAYDVDVYQIWAESLVYNENRSFKNYSFKYYVTHFGRSDRADYLHSPEEIRRTYADRLLLEKEPPKSISGGMGSHIFLLRSVSKEELKEQAEYILKHADGTDWKDHRKKVQ